MGKEMEERLNIVAELYASHPMSIAYAAEVAGVSVIEMNTALKAAGVIRLGYNDHRTEATARKLAKRL